jgi:hypothetical protein
MSVQGLVEYLHFQYLYIFLPFKVCLSWYLPFAGLINDQRTVNTYTYLTMEEAALSSRLNTQEKLLISQAVYKLGAVNWEKISALLENHPVIEGRPKEWFDATTVEAYYVGLMTEIGQNVYVSFILTFE